MSGKRSQTALQLLLAAVPVLLAAAGASAAAKPDIVVAQVGKTRIYLGELNRAAAPYKYQYEQQGYEFASDQGRSLYQQLQSSVLNNMIGRVLLDQGAAAKKITLSDAELEQGYKNALKQRKQSEQALLKELKAFGWTKEIFRSDLKRQLIEDKFIKTVIARGKSGDARDAAVSAWFQDAAGKTDIQVFFQVNAGGGDALKEAEKAGLEYYRKKYGNDSGLSAKAANYGCHIQVDIIKGGKIIKSLGYSGGSIYEI